MAFNERYRRQVQLLLRTIPAIAKERCFALKGGTAINLFVRDLPRLSVDIDLTYVPVSSRAKSMVAIDKAMRRIESRLSRANPSLRTQVSVHEGAATKLVVREFDVQVVIEVTPVMRGCAYEPELRSVSPAVEAEIGFAEISVLSFADLYAGKIVAALDRQHPRDLFDVHLLLANEGITDEIRAAFIVYLLSHARPMSEVLAARPKDIVREFEQGFAGMTAAPVVLKDLVEARAALVEAVVGRMPEHHRRFLVSFESGSPDWSLLEVPHARKLPAVKWRIQNLGSITADRRARLVDDLVHVLRMPGSPARRTEAPPKAGRPKRSRRPKATKA